MKINGPWKIKESQEKYKNHWLRVCEDKVIRPDGEDGIVGVVELREGALTLAIDDEGYVYLTEQFRYILEKNSVEVVGGAVEEDEESLDAAKRELREEAGIVADEWIFMGKIDPFTTAIKSTSTLYLARQLKFVEVNPDATEQIKILKVKFEDALKMVMDGKITQSGSCVLILKTAEYLRNSAKEEE